MLAVFFGTADNSWSASDAVKIAEVSVGFANAFKVGCWTPIVVNLDGVSTDDLSVRLTMPDPDGNPTVLPPLPVQRSGDSGQAIGLIRYGRIGGAIRIEVLAKDQVMTQKSLSVDGKMIVPVTQAVQFWLLVGENSAFRRAAARWNDLRTGSVYLSTPEDLPQSTSPLSLEGIDVVVIQASEKISARLSNHLRTWVQRGGKLVIIAGGDVENLRSGTLAGWLPFLPEGVDDLRDLGNLATLVPGSSTLRVRSPLSAARMNFTSSDGQVLANSLTGPLVVRSAYGNGTVTMSAVSLSVRPLSTWDEQLSTSDLAMTLMDLALPWKRSSTTMATAVGNSDFNELNPTGVNDFQTQLLNSVDQFDDMHRSTPLTVWVWLGLLVLVLGPVDYLLVHRVLKKPQLTWITFPIWLTVASLWALQSGTNANRSPLKARQIDLLDIDSTTQFVRGRSWFGFYSPETRRYNVSMHPEREALHVSDAGESYLGWLERAESSYRGMYRKGGLDLGKPAYQFSQDLQTVENLPVRIWSTGGTEGFWESHGEEVQALVQANLSDDGSRRLSGQLVHHLPGEIKDWLIAYESFAYFQSPKLTTGPNGDALAPGERFDIEKGGSNMLRGLLVGQTYGVIKGKKQEHDRTTSLRDEYDPFSRDPFGILRTMTFHDAAGGQEFSGLNNHPLESEELSRLVKLNRAVLFGRFSRPTTKFSIDDQPSNLEQHDSFVRIILPVNRTQRDPNAPPSKDLLERK